MLVGGEWVMGGIMTSFNRTSFMSEINMCTKSTGMKTACSLGVILLYEI